MIAKLLIVLTLVLGLAHGQNTIQLLGRLRDFSNSNSGQPQAHKDFNSFLGSELNIVKPDLGVDGKPVFNAATKITSAATFDQWYRDVAGVNIPFDYTLTLTDNGNGIYTYDNGNFFPLDGQGYGNDAYPHNFGFTLEVHTVFTFVKGQEFYFRGDDDLWVFINKKLVIDLGGTHSALEKNVKLNDLGLTEGEDYTLDIFFAERHYDQSNFKIQTSIQLKPSCSPPQIYNEVKNKCQDCTLPEVYILADNACGYCTGSKVYNSKTFACEECVGPTVYDSKSDSCVECSDPTVYNWETKACENCVAPQVYNPTSKACEDCPAPTVYDSNKKTCVSCPENEVYLGDTKTCGTCPGPKVYHPITYTCGNCPENEVYLGATKTCGSCSAPHIYNPVAYTCDTCPENQLYIAGTKSCGTCPGPKVYDPITYICDNCPVPEFYNYDGTCVPDCAKNLQGMQGGFAICNFPCKKTQIYQVALNKCRCDCPQPYTKTTTATGYQLCTIIEAQLS